MHFRSMKVSLEKGFEEFSVKRTILDDMKPRVRRRKQRADTSRDAVEEGREGAGCKRQQGDLEDAAHDVQMHEGTHTVPDTNADAEGGTRVAEQQATWHSLRPELRKAVVECTARNVALMQARKAAAKAGVEAALQEASSQCRSCGSRDQLTHVSSVQVQWVGLSFTFVVDVPISTCHACGAHSAPLPPMAGCFPAMPVRDWDVTAARDGASRPVWFDTGLLQEVDSFMFAEESMSVSSLCRALTCVHAEHGSVGLSHDAFCESLTQALAEYHALQSEMADMQGS